MRSDTVFRIVAYLGQFHRQRPKPRASRRTSDLVLSVCMAASRSQGVSTRITALVEPPEGDLGLMEREGGCRLILA
jgi:hypothetical protein